MEVDEQDGPSGPKSDNTIRKTSQELIENYFSLLTKGCGNTLCLNQYCASSPQFFKRTVLSPNEAALEAIKLVKTKVDVQCTEDVGKKTCSGGDVSASQRMAPGVTSQAVASQSTSSAPSTSSLPVKPPNICKMSESLVKDAIATCKRENRWSELVKLIGGSFSQIDVLLASFRLDTPDPITGLTLDVNSLLDTYSALFSLPEGAFSSALVNAIVNLSTDLSIELQYRSAYERDPNILNVLLIILSLPCLDSPEYLEQAYPAFLKALTHLPLQGQKSLVQIFVWRGVDYLRSLLTSLQQLITIRVVSQSERWSDRHILNNDDQITSAAQVMKLIYYASIMGGDLDDSQTIDKERNNSQELRKSIQEMIRSATEAESVKETKETKEDPLAQALGIRPIDCRVPLIPRHEFINDMINDTLEMDQDFTYYRAQNGKFTFIQHSFLLNTSTKNLAMYYDNRIKMMSERRSAILSSLMNGEQHMPYLRLRVRRDHIIDDALVGLEMVFMNNPDDLKKQLYVEFEGEQGIDEGGVSKEFFQLITEEIFNPDYGMFIYDDETRQFWFNPDSFEIDKQFTLVGILLGLAIYNNIILDARLPMVAYRKLMGKLGTLDDMESSHPMLFSSLKQLLECTGDVEEEFMISFSISRTSMFGEIVSHPLKEGGANIFVNNENRKEYCDAYADYLLNQMVQKQFNAFFRGFHMVTEESPLETLFTPEEVEELVCGSSDWDFKALEDSTEYDGGFDIDSNTIKHFWQVVHGLTVEDQKRLLQFVSGSDRVPVGGLAKLKLVIAKNGPDSDRLPTSHTCFNVLLLPDYRNLDKLRERLMLVITHAKGFGML